MLSLLETSGLQANAMISQLNEIFPPTNPTPDDTMEKIMYRSGQRSVVEWVINYMEQN
jgi:predicted nucleotide-binding protein (sugar kinase/HSP70/actin superfamily)